MKCPLVRLLVWFVALVIFPVPVTVVPWSFQVEVLQGITLAALPQERTLGLEREWTERVLVHLERAEKKEIDPWLRDDVRIAWITVGWSQRGVPESAWHRESSPHVAATYQVLHCLPDQVWPRIVAARKAKLGAEYDAYYDEHGNWRVDPAVRALAVASSPKKPCVSERRRVSRKKKAGENLAV